MHVLRIPDVHRSYKDEACSRYILDESTSWKSKGNNCHKNVFPNVLTRNIIKEHYVWKVWRTKKFDFLLRYLTPFSARILELSWRKSAASYQTLGWWPRQRRHCSKANMTRLAIKRGSSTFNGFDFSHEMYFCQRSIWKQECRCNQTRSNSKNIG